MKYKNLLEVAAANQVTDQYLRRAKKFLTDKVRRGEYPYIPAEWVDFVIDAPSKYPAIDLFIELVKAGVERIPAKL